MGNQDLPSVAIGSEPLHRRPIAGFGVECDSYLYDATNRAANVDEQDYALIERRLRAMRPSIARMFCSVDWFNPGRDGVTFDWETEDYRNLRRLLRLLASLDTQVNLVLFAPFWGLAADAYPPLVDAMTALLAHLRDAEDLHAVRWLTVYNEPETQFPHDSPLMRRVFGDDTIAKRPGWEVWLRLVKQAHRRLVELGLYPRVRMAVPDCVYGSPIRYERMRLAAPAFADLDVSYAVHVYSPEHPEKPGGDIDTPGSDWYYPGMAREAADYRHLIGPDKEMILWEYNLEGLGGRTPFFPGVNRHGVSIMETVDSGPAVLLKTMLAFNHGYDGACLWCLCDMAYCGNAQQMMTMGLWRYKNCLWYPRPHYYYFAPLCQLFRRGMTALPVSGVQPPLYAIAARGDDGCRVALLNASAEPRPVKLALPDATPLACLRVHPDAIPAEGGDLPLDDWQPFAAADPLVLKPREAVFLKPAEA